jgi:hypothetical protein
MISPEEVRQITEHLQCVGRKSVCPVCGRKGAARFTVTGTVRLQIDAPDHGGLVPRDLYRVVCQCGCVVLLAGERVGKDGH